MKTNVVLCGVALACAELLLPPSHGEESEQFDDDIVEVVVTGTRIRKEIGDDSTSIGSLTTEDIERAGQSSLGDLLARLPVSGTPLSTKINLSGNVGFPPDGGGIGAGSSHVDLRHLGSKRVLVLVDGLRWIHGTSGSGVPGATDLNTIPLGAIERIDLLTDGASAIYGSDAVAGVVNVITKAPTDNDLYIRVGAGSFIHGGTTKSVDANLGLNFTNTDVGVYFGYTDQALISSSNHEQTRYPNPGTGVLHGSSFTPQGRVIFTDPHTGNAINCTLDDGVIGLPRYDPAEPCGSEDDYHPWSDADRFNYAPFNLVLTPSERLSLFSTLNHRIMDSLEFTGRLIYNRRNSLNRAAPEPLWIGPLAASGQLLDDVVVSRDNPYNPFGIDIGGDGAIWVTRRPLESGPRIFEQTVDTLYASGSLVGYVSVLDRMMYWDLNLVIADNTADQVKLNSHNSRRIMLALGDPNACVTLPGCTPLNFFGGIGQGEGTISDDMLNWIRFVQHDTSDQSLRDLSFNVTGDLYKSEVSQISFAAGIERRELSGSFTPDLIVSAGDTAGAAAQPTTGSHEATEYYLEVESSVLSRDAEVDRISVSLAARGFNYSTFGTGSTFKVSTSWRMTSDLRFNASFAEGFRVPNIGELFGGRTYYHAVISDPCSALDQDESNRLLRRNCIAAGVPADGSYQQHGSQISVLTGGNPNLDPESSVSTSLKLVYEVPGVEDLVGGIRFDAGYFNIELSDTITAFDAQNLLDGCYRFGIAVYCSYIERNLQGGIRRFQNTLFNIGTIDTDGWDAGVSFLSPQTEIGIFGAEFRLVQISSFTETTQDELGSELVRRSLLGRTQNDRGIPEVKAVLNANWSLRRWEANWTLRYISALEERCSNFQDDSPSSFANLGLCTNPDLNVNSNSLNKLDSIIYNDVQGQFKWRMQSADVELTFGANNLFDVEPPTSYSALLNGYDASTYEFPGSRYIYLAVSVQM